MRSGLPVRRRERITLVCAMLLLAACTRTDPDHFSGYAEADFIYVAPAVSGRVQLLAVDRGARVERGTTLFQLEPDVQAFERATATARVEQAAAQISNLRKGKRVDELRAIEQQLAQARASLELSSKELERAQTLVKQGFISSNRLDELRSARARDAARVAEVQAQLATARDAARPDEIAAAEAERRAAESELASTRWREDQTRGIAAQSGTVQDVMYRVGEWVQQGAPVVAILPDGAVKLRFFVPQEALARIRVGDTVAIGCDGCPAGMSARVSFIATEAEFTPPVIYSNESRAKLVFMVEARPDDTSAKVLKPGQPIDARLAPRS